MVLKKIMVLGASFYQLEAINCALRLGLYVVTLDNRPENPGHRLAHQNFNLDTTDREAVLRVAQEVGINAIIAPATDVALPTAAYVAEKLGLPGTDFSAAVTLCDKAVFREFQQRIGLPAPETFTGIPSAELFHHQRWIIKPARSSGSKGIFILENLDDYLRYQRLSSGFSLDGRVVLEEFITGFQGTVEGVVQNGRIGLDFFLDRQTVAPPYVATSGHNLPTLLDLEHQALIKYQLEQVFAGLKVADGPFDADFVISNSNGCPYLLELAPRLGGNSISRLIAKATNFDLVEFSVRSALGESPLLPDDLALRPVAVVLLGVAEAGFLSYNREYLKELQSILWVSDIDFSKDYMAEVPAFINGQNRLGELFVTAADREQLDFRVSELLQKLNLCGISRHREG